MSDDLTGSNEHPEFDDNGFNSNGFNGEAIHADSVSSPRSSAGQLAARTVTAILSLLRRANRLAAGVLVVAGGVCVIGFLLGLAALDGGARTVWMVFGGALVLLAIGSVVLSMWRLSVVGRMTNALTNEIGSLISSDRDSERAVIETVQVTEDSVDVGVVQVSRQFFSLRDVIDDKSPSYPALSATVRAITGLPLPLILATFVALAFVPISLIFLLILIF